MSHKLWSAGAEVQVLHFDELHSVERRDAFDCHYVFSFSGNIRPHDFLHCLLFLNTAPSGTLSQKRASVMKADLPIERRTSHMSRSSGLVSFNSGTDKHCGL